jgi:hypothetical protein
MQRIVQGEHHVPGTLVPEYLDNYVMENNVVQPAALRNPREYGKLRTLDRTSLVLVMGWSPIGTNLSFKPLKNIEAVLIAMILPSKRLEIAFAEFLEELPPDYAEWAYEFHAFTRRRKIQSPAQLLQLVMPYSGLDKVLREVAGDFTLVRERMADPAVHPRFRACGP